MELLDYQATAIILKINRLGDSDKILSLYSKEHGLIKAVAKGAYKITSKFCAKTDVLNYGEFLIAKGRNLDIIREIKISDSFKNIRQNYLCLNAAFFLVDILDQVAIKDEHYEIPFDLILDSLNALNSANQQDLRTFIEVLTYQWKLIEFLGYKPELNYCSQSLIKREEHQIPEYFDFENGSITSREEFEKFIEYNPYQDQIKSISPVAFKVLNRLDQKTEPSNFNESDLISAIKLLHKHLEYRLHKEIKSWKILESTLAVSAF